MSNIYRFIVCIWRGNQKKTVIYLNQNWAFHSFYFTTQINEILYCFQFRPRPDDDDDKESNNAVSDEEDTNAVDDGRKKPKENVEKFDELIVALISLVFSLTSSFYIVPLQPYPNKIMLLISLYWIKRHNRFTVF